LSFDRPASHDKKEAEAAGKTKKRRRGKKTQGRVIVHWNEVAEKIRYFATVRKGRGEASSKEKGGEKRAKQPFRIPSAKKSEGEKKHLLADLKRGV